MRRSGGTVPKHIATGILALIERLPPGDGLCHGDLHPGNVIMTADGPRLIDWAGAVRAPAALDLASCHVLLSELAPEVVDDPERPRAVNAAAQSEYARLAGMSPAALTAAMEPYLPIVRVFVLLGGRGACPAGAADPAHRSGPAPGGLKRSAVVRFRVPRNTPHAFQNIGTEPGVLLFGVTPGGFEKMFAERQGVDADTNQKLMAKHHMQVVGPASSVGARLSFCPERDGKGHFRKSTPASATSAFAPINGLR